MKVLIVGYGSMGKEVERVLLRRNHTVAGRIDPVPGVGDAETLTPELLAEADVAIEFSLPSAVPENARRYAEAGVSAVVGTTGWDTERDRVENVVRGSGIGYLTGTNFSIGAHLFFAVVSQAAKLLNGLPDYDIFGYEIHHRRKKDSPSGTALTLARKILEANGTKQEIQTDRLDRQIRPEEFHMASVRGGSVPGIHTVMIDSEADTVEITHTARSRGGFALGAVMAAEWLAGKHGVFSVDDFISETLA